MGVSRKICKAKYAQSGEALKRALQKDLDNSSPLDDFIQVIKDLAQFELKYKLDFQAFFALFQAGKRGDNIEFMRWATKYELYQEMKAEIRR